MLLPDRNLRFWQNEDIFKVYYHQDYHYINGRMYSLADLTNIYKDYEANPQSSIWQEEDIQAYKQIWFDLARNIVSNMFIEAGVSVGMIYTLDEPPPRSIEVYTDIE